MCLHETVCVHMCVCVCVHVCVCVITSERLFVCQGAETFYVVHLFTVEKSQCLSVKLPQGQLQSFVGVVHDA